MIFMGERTCFFSSKIGNFCLFYSDSYCVKYHWKGLLTITIITLRTNRSLPLPWLIWWPHKFYQLSYFDRVPFLAGMTYKPLIITMFFVYYTVPIMVSHTKWRGLTNIRLHCMRIANIFLRKSNLRCTSF